MVHIRYSRWDRNGRDSLDSDTVFDQLNEYMNDTGDLQQAMRRLMQKGIKQGEKQTKGIDDLLSQVAREMRKLYDEYRLQSAMDEVQDQLESIVDQERQTLEELDQAGQDTQEKKQFLNNLPGKVQRCSRKTDFLPLRKFQRRERVPTADDAVGADPQAGKLAAPRGQSLSRPNSDAIPGVAGPDGADGGLAASRRSTVEHAAADVDKDLLEKLLGGDPKQDFEGVMRMQSLLEEGGYVLEQGDRFELTPRGIRRVGQLALRDIYQQLRRDGMGKPLDSSPRQPGNPDSRIAGPMSRAIRSIST